MPEIKTENNPLKLAGQWMLDSGIQSPEGGFFVWYDLINNSHSFLYSEITGYGITALLFLRKLYSNDIFLERAIKAAEWIEKSALHPCGGVKARLYQDDAGADRMYSFHGENLFTFDSGMVLYALVCLYKTTGTKQYLDMALKISSFVLEMQNSDGSLNPIYQAKTNSKITNNDKWSNQPGSFLAKVSLGLIELFKVTGREEYKKAAVKLCEFALTKQDPSGRFITDESLKTTHLHPHCYTAEGLWYAGTLLTESNFTEAANRAVSWVIRHAGNMGINELYEPKSGSFNDFQRSDVLAQALRLGNIFCPNQGGVKLLKDALLEYQYINPGSAQNGGFFYSKKNRHVNSWCTMFALQAIALQRNYGPELFI